MTLIDIVVAVRNEELTLIHFVESIRSINVTDSSIRMIFIEDGSTDNTLTLLNSLKRDSKDIDAISLYNHFGQGVALAWGIVRSNADAVISIDADGSHPVEIIKEMIAKYHEGYDVVQGIRIEYRRDSLYRQVGSKIYFFFFSLVTGIDLNKQNVHFRLMNKKSRDIFINNKPWWYSLRTNFKRRDNIKTFYIPFTAPERASDKSKFNFSRLLFFAFRSFLTLTKPSRFFMLLMPLVFFVCLIYSINFWISSLFLLLLTWLVISYLIIKNIDYSSLVKEKFVQ